MKVRHIFSSILTLALIIAISAGIIFVISQGGDKSSSKESKNQQESLADSGKMSGAMAEAQKEGYKDGRYEGSAQGYGGQVTVAVTIKDGKIAEIEILSQNESPEYFARAKKVLEQIKATNSPDVDAVSGATISSDALKLAVFRALQQALPDGRSVAQESNLEGKIEEHQRQAKEQSQEKQKARKARLDRLQKTVSPTVFPKDSKLKDGSYQGSADGFDGKITVRVTIANGKIADVEVLSNSDTPSYFNRALAVIGRIKGRETGSVDTVSGATYSSRGIIDAVNNALSKAIVKNPEKSESGQIPTPEVKPENPSRPDPSQPDGPSKPDPSKPDNPSKPDPGKDPEEKWTLKDGDYQGSADGFKSEITVQVSVKDGKVADIKVVEQSDSRRFFQRSLAVLESMKGKKSGSIDTVSGATYSSRGIINAVNDALSKAVELNQSGTGEEVSFFQPMGGTTKPSPKQGKILEDKTRKNIAALLRKGELKSGSYQGLGAGFNTSKGRLKTQVSIEDNEIKDIEVGQGKDYADDGEEYRARAVKVVPFLMDKKKGRHNIAVMKLHHDYLDRILAADNPKKMAEKLIGKDYAAKISDSRKASEVSRAIKAFLQEKMGERDVFDAVSGATISAGGLARSVDQALELSETDAKTGNEIVSISIVSPSDINVYNKQSELKQNRKKPLDLSGLVVELTKKDGSKVSVPYASFGQYRLEIRAQDGQEIKDGMDISKFVKNGTLITDITHKESKRSARLGIVFGAYSKDYIVSMEYRIGDGAWKTLDQPQMSDEKSENISERQTIKLSSQELGKKLRFRTRAKSGQIYLYESNEGIAFKKMTLPCMDSSFEDNENANFALFITVDEDKADQPSPNPGQPTGEDEIQVDFAASYLNHQKVEGIPVKTGEGVLVRQVQGLPGGLSYRDGKISGAIDIADSEFDDSMSKEYSLTILGSKAGQEMTVQKKLLVFQDKDRDGISDNDEGEHYANQFTPLFKGQTYQEKAIYKEAGDPEPTMEEYRALFKNIPDDDSVTIEVLKHPDMSVAGNQIVKLQFKSKYVSGLSKISVALIVEKAGSQPEGPAQEAKAGDIQVNFPAVSLNHQVFSDTKVSCSSGIKLISAEGLPSGLSLSNGSITGKIDIPDADFDGSFYRTYPVKLYGKKAGKKIVMSTSLGVYQDRDRDGINDNDEGDHYANEFTAQFKGSLIINKKVGDPAPTEDDYKAMIKNLPDDGSVRMEIVGSPDMTRAGYTVVKLRFHSTYVTGVSSKSIGIRVE